MSSNDSRPANPQPTNPLKRFIEHEQDPVIVQQTLSRVKQILTSGETVEYIAIQKQLVSLAPDCAVLTNKRFIIYKPTLLGAASFRDFIWRDLSDVHLNEGVLRSTISFKTVKNQVMVLEHLPKVQARRVYAFAQEMEEKVREERRARDMEEKRAAAGGIVLQGGFQPGMAGQPAAADNPVEKLKSLKEMLDAGLITQDEYDSKKADILSKM